MPSFDFGCLSCGENFTTIANAEDRSAECPICGGTASKQFSPTKNLKLASWCRREVEDSRARQRAYIESPAVQKALKAGTMEIDTSDPNSDNMDGDEASSSISSRKFK
jgi:putative FmdB family regulatory protein